MGQISHPVLLGYLVHDFDRRALFGWMRHGQSHTTHRIADMNERARLTPCAVPSQRMTNGRLHQKAVQKRAVVPVVIKTVDPRGMQTRFIGLRTPNDALMQVRDPDFIVTGIELKQR